MEDFDDIIFEKAGRIKLLLSDCDGVLTDGTVYYSKNGEELKRFSLRDGMGVERLAKLVDVETGIITGEDSEIVRKRAEKLGIKEYYPGCKDKGSVFKDILLKKKLKADQVAYIGDDFNDIGIIEQVGLSACPSDAIATVKSLVYLVMENKGGSGAFREFAELIIFFKQKSR